MSFLYPVFISHNLSFCLPFFLSPAQMEKLLKPLIYWIGEKKKESLEFPREA